MTLIDPRTTIPAIVRPTTNGGVIVELSFLEFTSALFTGCGRTVEHCLEYQRTGYDYEEKWNRGKTSLFEAWAQMIGGTPGECATGNYLGLYWGRNKKREPGKPKPADVGNDVEVRATDKLSNCLMVHDEDVDARPFVLAILTKESVPKVHLPGWMWAHEAKDREKYWRDPTKKNRFAYFVPQRDLYAMHELLDLVKRGLVS